MTYEEEIVICDRCKFSRLASETVLIPVETGLEVVCNICYPPILTASQNETQYIDMSEFNPTKPDVADFRNVEIATKMFGMVACDGWSYMNFGSAGGAALMKTCSHENGKCWPSMTTGNMSGKVGGCPEFTKNWNCCKDIVEHIRAKGDQVSVLWRKNGVTAVLGAIGGAVGQGETMEEAVVEAAIKYLTKTSSL